MKFASALLALATPSIAAGVASGQIKDFVTFGDSHTDTSYYHSADGGYAAGYSPFNLLNQTHNGTLHLGPEETIYTTWIGTNDLGMNALLTASDTPDVSIVQVRQCAVVVFNILHENGTRNSNMQNTCFWMLPLDLTILYSDYSYPNKYRTVQRNATGWNVYMKERVRGGNEITYLMPEALPHISCLTRLPTHPCHASGLFTDIYNNPHNYLNDTAPLNVTGPDESTRDLGVHTVAEGGVRDSFTWYDELNPSEQSDRIAAHEITAVMKDEYNQWATRLD
ncbi:carbohydrate esterase family 16 protein [Paxillus rubicundulus Ve08.2h10]|uniref:Carbohydrate esterase family 16 protein n=1 Tax=Paxillus rubicundulus Ve08.2h10 TaxID=930991 RepID=A0A0D0E0G7_9AGAM|nr:carbohydrate esterase family 16 protein [Paxillus rubicundulus Ve08.2h10]